MKSWAEVEASPDFAALPAPEQDAARQQYFAQVVAPQVPEAERGAARAQFDQATRIRKVELPAGVAPSTRGAGLATAFEKADPRRTDVEQPGLAGIRSSLRDGARTAWNAPFAGVPDAPSGMRMQSPLAALPAPEPEASVLDRPAGTAPQSAAGTVGLPISKEADARYRQSMATATPADLAEASRGTGNVARVGQQVFNERKMAGFKDRTQGAFDAVEKVRSRTPQEFGRDVMTAGLEGIGTAEQILANVAAPDSQWAATVRGTIKAIRDDYTPQKKYQDLERAGKIKAADGEWEKAAVMLGELLGNPTFAIEEIVKQAPLMAGMVGATLAGGAAGALTARTAVAGAMRVAPTVALADAITGGGLVAGASAAGGTAGTLAAGRVAGGVAAAGDAGAQVFEKLTDKKATPDALLLDNADFKQVFQENLARGMDGRQALDAARLTIATSRSRLAQAMAAPLGIFAGSVGLEKVLAYGIRGGAKREVVKEVGGEVVEEIGTQMAGNRAVQTVDPKQTLMEGAGEAGAMAMVTSAPLAGLTAYFGRSDQSAMAPTQARASSIKRFDEAAAAWGLNPKAAAAVREQAGTKPADDVPGFLARAMAALNKRGMYAKPVDDASVAALDARLRGQAGEPPAAAPQQATETPRAEATTPTAAAGAAEPATVVPGATAAGTAVEGDGVADGALAAVPFSAFNGDMATGLDRTFLSEENDGSPVPLNGQGFTDEEVAALEAAGLATNGRMSREQWGRYSKEKSLRDAGGRGSSVKQAEAADAQTLADAKRRAEERRSKRPAPAVGDLPEARRELRTAMGKVDAVNAEWESLYRDGLPYFSGDGPSRKLSPNAPDALKARYAAFKAAKKEAQRAYDDALAKVNAATPAAAPAPVAPAPATEAPAPAPKPRQLNGSDAEKARALFTPQAAAAAPASPEGDFTGLDTPSTPQAGPAPADAPIAGEQINRNWTAFAPESGTLSIPREQMPQISAEHRGALVQFLKSRGIEHQAEEVDAASLKPTQAEFSPKKVQAATDFTGGNRSILVSADGYILDGTHQWLSAREAGRPVKTIRLNAPIQDLLRLAHQFPSSTTAAGPRKAADGNQPDLAVPAPVAAGAADSGADQPGGSGGNVGPLADAGSGTPPAAAALVAGGADPAPAGNGAQRDAALNDLQAGLQQLGGLLKPKATAPATYPTGELSAPEGARTPPEAVAPQDLKPAAGMTFAMDGKRYTVKKAYDTAVSIEDEAGKVRNISRISEVWPKMLKAMAAEAPASRETKDAAAPAQQAPAQARMPDAAAPGSDAGNGFKHGPAAGERYRVGVVDAVGGAVTLEKRLPAGTNATFYVGKDGGLVDGDTVNLLDRSTDRLWIPADAKQAEQAQSILDEMGRMALTDPARKAAKDRLKALVTAPPEVSRETPAAKPAKPKVFKTRAGAEAAKAGNTQRLKKVQGGYILRQATDKEMEAADKAGKRLAGGGGVDVERDSLLQAIAKLGGISLNERSDTIGEGNRNIGGKMLFTSAGRPLDELARNTLRELGYVPKGEVEADGGVRWLRDAIKSEFMGTAKHHSEQGSAWMEDRAGKSSADMTDAEYEAQRAAYEAEQAVDDGSDWANGVDSLADFTPDDLQEAGYTGLSPVEQAEVEQLLAEAESLGIDTEALREDAARATAEESADAYHAEVKALLREAIAAARAAAAGADAAAARERGPGDGQPAGDQGQEGADQGLKRPPAAEGDRIRFTGKDGTVIDGMAVQVLDTSGGNYRIKIRTDEPAPQGGGNISRTVYSQDGTFEPLEDAPLLTAQTTEDLKAKAEREEAGTKAAAAQKAAEQERLRKEAEARDLKARADATVDDFQLGQDASVQMSGMSDMFADAPAPAPAAAPAASAQQVPADGPTPNYKAGDRITPDKDVMEGDVVKYRGAEWMAKVKRGIGIPLLPMVDGKPQVSADTKKLVDVKANEVIHTGTNVYGYGGQPKPSEKPETPAESKAIPKPVQDRVRIALQSLRGIEELLSNIQRARGNGHILALEWKDQQENMAGPLAKIAEFRALAGRNGIDAESVIEKLGGEPDLERFNVTPAAAPAPASAPVGDMFGAKVEDVAIAKRDLEAQRRALVDLEDRMVGMAGLRPGMLEDALRSRKVPKALKDQRDAIREDMTRLREQIDRMEVPVRDMGQYIKVAADSIEQLRKTDVYRVLVESNRAEFRADIATYIKANRPDLAAEVDEVMAEQARGEAPPAVTIPPDAKRAAMQQIEAVNEQWNKLYRDGLPYFKGDPVSSISPSAPQDLKDRYEAYKRDKEAARQAYFAAFGTSPDGKAVKPAKPAPTTERPTELIELRKRLSVLEALRKCIAS